MDFSLTAEQEAIRDAVGKVYVAKYFPPSS